MLTLSLLTVVAVNAGERVLSCIFDGWLAEQAHDKERTNAVMTANKTLVALPPLSLPPHPPVMISDIRSGVPLLRTTLEQIDGSVDVPMWVSNCLLRVRCCCHCLEFRWMQQPLTLSSFGDAERLQISRGREGELLVAASQCRLASTCERVRVSQVLALVEASDS